MSQTRAGQPALAAALARLRLGDRVMIVTGGGTIQATVDGITDSALDLGNARSTVPFDRIDSLWTRGSAVRTGVALGGLTGALLGGIVLSQLESSVCAGSACDTGGYFALGALGGAVSGAVVGAVIGAAIPRWHRRFP